MAPVEYHEIGTPRKNSLCVIKNNGVLFVYNSVQKCSDWKGSLFQLIIDKNVELLRTVKDSSVFGACRSPIDGSTLVHYAAAIGHKEIMSMLISNMDRVHDPDTASGIRPLAIACRYGHSHIVSLLIEAGAIVAAVDRDGNTCLHEAARFAQNKCLRFVLDTVTSAQYGPLLSHALWMKNLQGLTCYDIAIQECHSDTADLIISYMRGSINET